MALPTLKQIRVIDAKYRDIDMVFAKHPVTNDIVVKTDIAAINSALSNLLLIDRGEYLFQPMKGAGIRRMLFDNITPAVIKILKEMVKDTINIYEPRASLEDVEVFSEANSNQITIKISYVPVTGEDVVTTTVLMERAR